jgi:hypothetical protein
MAEKFVIPLVAESVSAFRGLVQENGGPEQFFQKLSDNTVGVISEFVRNHRRLGEVLLASLSNEDYRRRLVEAILDDGDKSFINEFFAGWDEWRRLYPVPYEFVELLLMGSLRSMLLGPIPEQVNDMWDCDTNLYLDAFRENLYVKSVMKLFRPDKELGGPNGLVISSSLESYLRSIQLMLNSLSLRDSEINLIRVPSGRKIIDETIEVLNTIEKTIGNLRKQFELMKLS